MIRDLTPHDYPRFAELATQLGYPVDAAYAGRQLQKQAQNAGETTLVYDQDGRGMVGWIGCRVVEPAYRPPYGEITGLVIDDSCRSRGYGAELLAAAEDWFRSRGLGEVLVRSNVTREGAHRFYDREGYGRFKVQQVFQKKIG